MAVGASFEQVEQRRDPFAVVKVALYPLLDRSHRAPSTADALDVTTKSAKTVLRRLPTPAQVEDLLGTAQRRSQRDTKKFLRQAASDAKSVQGLVQLVEENERHLTVPDELDQRLATAVSQRRKAWSQELTNCWEIAFAKSVQVRLPGQECDQHHTE